MNEDIRQRILKAMQGTDAGVFIAEMEAIISEATAALEKECEEWSTTAVARKNEAAAEREKVEALTAENKRLTNDLMRSHDVACRDAVALQEQIEALTKEVKTLLVCIDGWKQRVAHLNEQKRAYDKACKKLNYKIRNMFGVRFSHIVKGWERACVAERERAEKAEAERDKHKTYWVNTQNEYCLVVQERDAQYASCERLKAVLREVVESAEDWSAKSTTLARSDRLGKAWEAARAALRGEQPPADGEKCPHTGITIPYCSCAAHMQAPEQPSEAELTAQAKAFPLSADKIKELAKVKHPPAEYFADGPDDVKPFGEQPPVCASCGDSPGGCGACKAQECHSCGGDEYCQPCAWCGQPKDAHGEPGAAKMANGDKSLRLCPVEGVTSQFYSPGVRPLEAKDVKAMFVAKDRAAEAEAYRREGPGPNADTPF